MQKHTAIYQHIKATKHIKKLMPLHQQKMLSDSDSSIINKLEKDLEKIPTVYNEEDSIEDNIVYAHYYTPKTDFYVLSQLKDLSFYGVWATNGKTNLKSKSVPISRFRNSKLAKLDINFKKNALKNIISQKKMKSKTTNQLIKETTYVKMLMPKIQQKALTQQNSLFSKSLVERLEKELSEIPKEPQGESIKKSTVYAHYFYGGSDWYITDITPKDKLMFGYVILNGDTQMAEAGYISMDEIVSNGRIELDFYFTKDTLETILHEKYPNYYPNPKKETKVVQNKSSKKINTSIKLKTIDRFSTEYLLIRRFYNLVKLNKTVSFRRIQLVYKAFQKAALDRSIRKTNKAADLFTKVNGKVVALFDAVNPTKSDANIDFTNKKLLEEMEAFVTQQKINYAITLLKSYINLQGLKPEIQKVNRLLKRINNAIEQRKINKNNRLYKELVNAKLELESYLGSPNKKIAPKQIGLSIPARSLCINRIKCDGLRKDGKLHKGHRFLKGGNVIASKKKAV